MDAYSFSLGTGEQLRIRMRGIDENIEARFQLYNSSGSLLVTSQLTGGIADAEPILITETGDYLLLAMDSRGNDTGSYGMSVERILSNECAQEIGCVVFRWNWRATWSYMIRKATGLLPLYLMNT